MVAKLKALVQFMARGSLTNAACTICGCLVASMDQPLHRQWHDQLNKENTR